MPAHKKQHFLPVAYLGQFGRPAGNPLRQRRIWRVSETHCGEVPVGSQCQEEYFYSRRRAHFCERYFSQIESVYGALMAKIAGGRIPTHEEMFLLFLCAVDFFARGFKFRVESEPEEFELYLKRIEIFKRKLINKELADASDDQRRAYVLQRWEFAVIPFSESAALLTSDSPSIWLASARTADELNGVLMPLTPLACFVGVRRDSYRVERKAGSPEDALVINLNVIENCVDAVFSAEAMTEPEVALVRTKLSRRQVVTPLVEGWPIEWIDYDTNPNLSFIVVSPDAQS